MLMNYYERHIGDYLKDTAHLSLLEHGVYTRLLDVYYTREGGIPANDAARLIGARSKEERAALQAVLSEFFELDGALHVQLRCEREIQRYQEKQSKARRSANARWEKMRSGSERNANASPEHMQDSGNSNANGMHPARAFHSPDTRHQTPDPIPSPLPDDDDGTPNQRAGVVAADWQPDRKILADLRFLRGVPEDFIDFQLAEFKAFWAAAPPKSEAHWNAKFLTRCAEQWDRKVLGGGQ